MRSDKLHSFVSNVIGLSINGHFHRNDLRGCPFFVVVVVLVVDTGIVVVVVPVVASTNGRTNDKRR